MSNQNDGFDFLKKMMEEQRDEQRLQAEEMQIRYAERRKQKADHRRRIEAAAMKICDMVEETAAGTEAPHKPEDITALAAALNHAAVAMHAAENYAESRPCYGTGLALGYAV